MMKIQETIHHGNYHNTRVVEISSVSNDQLIKVISTSPYATGEIAGGTIARMINDLRSTGSTYLGWADYRIVTNPEPIHARG